MVTSVLGRPAEAEAIAEFLDASSAHPAGLLLYGEAGIGKTTVWLAALEMAVQSGYQVLSARPAESESVLAYAALADMLGELNNDAWADIPEPQRMALDSVVLRTGTNEFATDPRAVAAGFLSLVKSLTQSGPVLLAVDDLQWLDSSSQQVIAFATRRLSGHADFLGTLRTDHEGKAAPYWLQLPKLAEMRRMPLGPLTLGALSALIAERLGQPLSRADMVQVYELSQGNPFYAVELARVVDDRSLRAEARLPGSLADLVRTRIESLHAKSKNVLLAAACVSAPTVELAAHAVGEDEAHIVSILSDAEAKGLVIIEGNRICFTHPLLSRGVYAEASTADRREMHRRLADIVDEPELRARHLARAVAWGDPHTLICLDDAAASAARRGAPAAAAELLELGVHLGGDTADRRIRLAGCYFDAGDCPHARAILEETIAELEPGPLRAQALSLLGPVRIFDDSFVEGVAAMERALEEAPDDPALRVPTLVSMLLPLFNTGQLADAAQRADGAVAEATTLGNPLLLSQALSVRAFLHFLRGDGLDESSLRSALDMEDGYTGASISSGFQMMFRARTNYAILLGWSGQLERAQEEFAALRQSCLDHGLENELIYVTYYSVQVEIWRGAFTEANALVEHAVERALQLGGQVSVGAAMTWRAALAAYAGDEQRVREDVCVAGAAMRRCGAHMLERWPTAILAFLEVSLGNYEAALNTLQPVLSSLNRAPDGTEIYLAECLPDAVEALVHLDRIAEADPLVARLEHNGRRLDRPWMLAVGARCRAMLHAAQGDLEAAAISLQEAETEHARLLMPFETARTHLVLGQVERRRRHRETAVTALRQARDAFDRMAIPLWADRAREELARTDVAANARASQLTVGEQRVAELAASGMTNREVAAELFISPKTVEANLVRIYRKLGIHSRAELGKAVGSSS
jgi:ATP/maltotriose-dependent transcriptional regulator MalT